MNCTWKGQTTQNNLYCDVCKINIPTEAEYALHEFSKKHCDNLLRIAKNKPVVTKQKLRKQEKVTIIKETPKVNMVTTQGNIAKYGYFVPGEVYDTNTESKEFNTEYDPYLQKYAENSSKECTDNPVQPVELSLLLTSNITSFKKKKKKKTKTCQICNVTLLTVPHYEAHMRSPQHSWRLKMSGMGVSAHFVKASSDLHTVETHEHSPGNDEDEDNSIQTDNAGTSPAPVKFPTLFCDICELLLNSEQQFIAHVKGKTHNDNVQKKAEIKAKKQQMENVNLNQLYCFSCKVALNNLQQYNEHKYGKKHKMKCRRLMREGITIPPEERVASWTVPRMDPNKAVVYPQMYERFLLETQQKRSSGLGNDCKPDDKNLVEDYIHLDCSVSYSNASAYQNHINGEKHQRLISGESLESSSSVSRLVFHNRNNTSEVEETKTVGQQISTVEESHDNNNETKELNIIGCNEIIKCSVCGLDFVEESQFGSHLLTDDHFKKIVQLKGAGKSDDEILRMLLKDRSVVKPDNLGRYSCSLCSVVTRSVVEYRQHVSSVLHKQTEEEYQKKRKIEVKSAVCPNEAGIVMCKLCGEGHTTLTEYNQHLHAPKHKEVLKAEKARKLKAKRRLLLQQRRVKQKYVISDLKRKDFACWRRNCEKNPSAKPKIPQLSTDSNESQSKMDHADKEMEGKLASEEETPKSEKQMRPSTWSGGGMFETTKTAKPLMAVNNAAPFLPRPPPLMGRTAWRPCYTPPFRPNPIVLNNPRGYYPGDRYQRGSNFRLPRPRYPSC